MTELEKMINGEIYFAGDDELYNLRVKAHKLCSLYNRTFDYEEEEREKILKELLPNAKPDTYFQGPLYCDYGFNIYTGENFYANFNITLLDCCPIRIGDNVLLGPNVSIVTPVHPLNWLERRLKKNPDGTFTQAEFAKPITIGSDCWLASNVTVLGGVTIGEKTVIGAGSVVTKDIPSNVFAAGVPCKVIKEI